MSHDLPQAPRFDWGQRVRATADLVNDGSFPDAAAQAVLVRTGEIGEVVQVGTHVDSGTYVYMVEFAAGGLPDHRRVIGCVESELAHA